MAGTILPGDGELRLGPVRLPAGGRFTPYEHHEPVAWLTTRTVPDPGLVWSALTDLPSETGLVPVVLNDDEDDYEDFFMDPCDVAQLDRLDAAEALAGRWEGELDDDEEQESWRFDDPAYEDGIRNAVWIGAVLRSWENRFGARLLAVGPGAEIRLLVERPPRTLGAAEKIAAEHSAFCTECGGEGLRTVREIAPALVNAPIWTFWWD